jgi:cell division protein FtsL
MKKIVLILFFTSYSIFNAVGSEIDSLLKVLDQTIDLHNTYMQSKELRIKSLKKLIDKPDISREETYAINSLLYKEFLKYNFDSALNYINLNLKIAESLDRREWIFETKFQLAHLLSASGLYIESTSILESIDKSQLTLSQKLNYFACYQRLNAELGMYSGLKENSDKYFGIANAFRDSLLASLDTKSNEYLLYYESKLQDLGKFDESRNINSILLSGTKIGSPEYALYAFQRAISYRIQGDTLHHKKYLILSAISDIKAATKDNASLTLLAILLFENKEIDRAYKYIKFSLEDAKFYNARLRFVEISKILPLISEAYEDKSDKQKAKLSFFAVVISVLAVFLVLALFFMYKQMKRLINTRIDLQKANSQLNELSQDLFKVNTQLKALNHELSEANHIKEEYIGFFLGMCSTYIDKLENYRKMVNRKVTSGQYEELFTTTKSSHFIDSELSEFYGNFDNTFLHLFPNFVEKFNLLLVKEERIILKIDELLNTELRIFALIRLGITDSSKIASFLRYSVNTIYNYRTRVRNKALVPRDDFERLVSMIGENNP